MGRNSLKDFFIELNDWIAVMLPSISIVVMIFIIYIIMTRGLR